MKKVKKILAAVLCAALTAASAGCSEEAKRGNLDEVELKEGDLIAEIDIENYGVIKAKLFPDVAPDGVEYFRKLADSGSLDGIEVKRVSDNFMMQCGATDKDGSTADTDAVIKTETDKSARHFYGALCYAANGFGNISSDPDFYIVNNKIPQDLSEYDISSYETEAAENQQFADQMKDLGMETYYKYYSHQAEYCKTLAEWLKSASDEVKELYKKRGGCPALDGNYAVFGQVYEGFDVIDAIAKVEKTDNGRGEISKPVEKITVKSVKVSEYKG